MPRLTITVPATDDASLDLPDTVLDPDSPDWDQAVHALTVHMDRLAIERLLLRVDRLFAQHPIASIKLGFDWQMSDEGTLNEEVYPMPRVAVRWTHDVPPAAPAVEDTVRGWLENAMGVEPGAMGGGRVQPLNALRDAGWITSQDWPSVSRRVHAERFGNACTGAWTARVETLRLHQALEESPLSDAPSPSPSRARL